MCQKVRFLFAIIVIAIREVVQDLCHRAHAIYDNHKQRQATKTDNIAQKNLLFTENYQNYTTINNQ